MKSGIYKWIEKTNPKYGRVELIGHWNIQVEPI